MTTIQDVAKTAGVSVATVSRVLNNSSHVSEKTRENVMKAMKALDYRPNLLGRNLRRTETRMILVLLPSISNPFYSRVVKGVEAVARENGYNIMLCNTDSERERELVYIQMLQNRLADGVIFMAPEMSSRELSEIGGSYPVVQCCEYKEGALVSQVSIDNFSAAYTAIMQLIKLGHKRIGLITCKNLFVSTIQRRAAYKKAIKDAGLVFDDNLIKYGNYSFKSGVRAAKHFLLMPGERPTAVFAISDIMAIGAIMGFKEKGIVVPDDISIIGFDDINYAAMYNPTLTTISQPQYELGCEAMRLLLMQIRGEIKHPVNVVLDHKLVIRDSIRRLPDRACIY
jgi:LacI family repressor for deo operon, udp, cdd, tsx, nupC, and nupG